MQKHNNEDSSITVTTRKEYADILSKRFSKHKIAKRTGLSYATVHKIIATEHSIAPETVKKIAEVLNIKYLSIAQRRMQ